jgi:hypothetical protein
MASAIVSHEIGERQNDKTDFLLEVAEPPWRPRTQLLPENKAQIERTDVNQLPLHNIFAASQIHPVLIVPMA